MPTVWPADTESHFELSGVPGISWSDTFSGWTVGGGLETKLAANWTLKAEYRYTEFDTKTFFDVLKLDSSVQTARLVLSYKFNLFGDDIIPLK